MRRLVCLLQGHNLIGVKLPDLHGADGWSWQTCRTCGEQVRGHIPRSRR